MAESALKTTALPATEAEIVATGDRAGTSGARRLRGQCKRKAGEESSWLGNSSLSM